MTNPEELEGVVRAVAAMALQHLGWPAEEPIKVDGPHDPYYEDDPEVQFELAFSEFHILVNIEPTYVAGGSVLVICDQPQRKSEFFAHFINPPLELQVH